MFRKENSDYALSRRGVYRYESLPLFRMKLSGQVDDTRQSLFSFFARFISFHHAPNRG